MELVEALAKVPLDTSTFKILTNVFVDESSPETDVRDDDSVNGIEVEEKELDKDDVDKTDPDKHDPDKPEVDREEKESLDSVISEPVRSDVLKEAERFLLEEHTVLSKEYVVMFILVGTVQVLLLRMCGGALVEVQITGALVVTQTLIIVSTEGMSVIHVEVTKVGR